MSRRSSKVRTAAAAIAVGVALSGCTTVATPHTTAPAREASALTATSTQQHQPVTVSGMASCAKLPQQASVERAADKRLPALTLSCLTPGPDLELTKLGGRPVLINLWASWCQPCKDEMPVLQDAYIRHGKRVAFVGIVTKDATKPAVEFLEYLDVTYPQAVDPEGQLLRHIRLPGLPVTILLDSDGDIAYKHIGPLTADVLNAELSRVM